MQEGLGNQPQWSDFCVAMVEQFQSEPGVPRPNYIDGDGWYYFLAEDARCVYRTRENMDQPEAVIEDARGCITVTDWGVLFLRGHEVYIGNTLWSVQYDLLLWQDGTEILLWEDTDISPKDGCMLSIGDFLFYHADGRMCIRPIFMEDDTIQIGAQIGVFPDCAVMQNLVWTDGTSVWYAIAESAYGRITTIRRMNLETMQYLDYEVSFAGSWDRGHSRPMAVYNGTLYYPTKTALYQLDLQTINIREITTFPEMTEATVYGTNTGESLLRLKYNRKESFSTTDLITDMDLSFLGKDTVQTICGNLVIAYEYEYINDYDYYPRTVVYRLDTSTEVWKPNGEYFYTIHNLYSR